MERLVIVNKDGKLALDVGEPNSIAEARMALNTQFQKALRKLYSYETTEERGLLYSYPSVVFNRIKKKWMFLYLDKEGLPQYKLFDEEVEARKEFMLELNKSVIL